MKHFNHYKMPVMKALVFYFLLPVLHLPAQTPEVRFNTTPVISGLTSAMSLVHAGDASNRIFIAERAGIIKVFEQGALGTAIVFLNMNSAGPVVSTTGEGGLLSVAFHPDYANNGFFYTYYTDTAGDLVLARYTATTPAGNVALASTRFEILKIPHPVNSNHNGGELHFGNADGYLYLSTGDGGSSNDPGQNGQNSATLLGKILRIDINPPSGSGVKYAIPLGNPFGNEVFALGLRNPFRWSFDRQTNAMWIGDVGQGSREEVNRRSAAATLGANYGWRCFEGDIRTPGIAITECPDTAGYVKPVYSYQTGSARGRSVIGGVVYRGTAWPAMQGYYIGTDYFSGDIHKISANGLVADYQTSTITGVTDIGEAESGEIYGVTGSAVYAIEAEPALPVTLVNFSGAPSAEGVKLSWQTSMEADFKAFEIEYSTDALGFGNVGIVPGANAPGGNRYGFSHTTALKGNLYYRLKMVDTDESFRYSRMITVSRDAEEMNENFVRPSLISTSTMNLLIEEPFQTVEVVNTGGQVVLTEKIGGRSGPVSIPLQATVSGIYIVRMAGHDRIVQQRVLVLR
nr:PQQ-dependent sugar dehydrogenase [uncultured Dyadobacter sp.]